MSSSSMEDQKHKSEMVERVQTQDYVVHGKHGTDFEKTYLAPEAPVAGALRKTFANPTPVALGGFLLANTPATIELMGWVGAGGGTGNAAAGTGSYMYFGGLLLMFGAIGEFILGNTFPTVVFFTFAGFWFTFGATLTPFYAAIASYTKADGTPDPAGFYNSFAWFLVFMSLLCAIYAVAALRTNICLVMILVLFTTAFPCLAAAYFYGARGHVAASNANRIAGGAQAFTASMIAWYLWCSMVFESVDFPLVLPVGDLSTRFKGRTERLAAKARGAV